MKNFLVTKAHFAVVLLLIIIAFTNASCSNADARPIEYGHDNCAYCIMTVSDARYGSQLVTSKGKKFMYDSVECLANHLASDKKLRENIGSIWVTDFTTPKKLINAENAFYLHSKELPSPMGMYITAFESEAACKQFHNEKGGKILTWNGVKEVCKNKEKP